MACKGKGKHSRKEDFVLVWHDRCNSVACSALQSYTYTVFFLHIIFFAIIITLMNFGLLNIVIGIFCETAYEILEERRKQTDMRRYSQMRGDMVLSIVYGSACCVSRRSAGDQDCLRLFVHSRA